MPAATDAKVQEARNKQSTESKRATLDQLKSKPRATMEFSIYIADEDGDKTEVTLKYRAIGAKEYDKLVAKHPPKTEQRAEGASFNMDTFAPALIAACCVEPEMSREDAQALWDSEDWSRGDLMVLFRNAVELNNRGIDIPFSDNG
jgi:hypothetical protein